MEITESYCVVRNRETGDRSRFFKKFSTANDRTGKDNTVMTRTMYEQTYGTVDPKDPNHKQNNLS